MSNGGEQAMPMGRPHKWPTYYPRSFVKLIVVGFILVALPLILAIANNALSIHDITERSQRTVHQAMLATESSRLLIEQITAMERSVRQTSALGDTSLLESYAHARAKFIESADRMLTLRLDAEQMRQLTLLRDREARLADAVHAAAAVPEALGALLNDFEALDTLAHSLSDLGAAIVEREVAALQSMAEGVQRFVFWQLVALVPVALLLIVGAIILISRPIRQIDAAIRRLGEGHFDTRVEVTGPQDLEHLGRQLDWMRLKLVDLEEQKRLFLHHVSHELKTPLAALKEGAGLLHEQLVGPLTPSQKEVALILKQNTQRLQELIERLLNYHAAQFQRTAVTVSEVALPELITRIGRQHKLTMASKGLRFQVDCPPLSIEGDRDKLAAILGNLISNAVKYAPRDGTVGVNVASEADMVRIEVTDDGPGIPSDERSLVFEPFYHGTTPHDGSMKGTGLGLAIVREFVLAHHGRIEIAPDDTGTRMRVELPRRQTHLIEEAAA